MGLQIFEIEFDNEEKTYYAGQSITGQVIVQVDHVDFDLQELMIRLWGKADVCWVDAKGKQGKPSRPKTSATPEIRISLSEDPAPEKNKTDKVFSDEETYFDRRDTILQKHGKEDLCIKPGRNTFPFEITVPSGIPSSFEGEHGSVKYFLETGMKRGPGKFEHSVKSQVYVKGILDLNSDPQCQIERPEINQEEHLCCFCWKSGPVGFTFGILGKTGVVPGENIEFLVDIYNMSEAKEVNMKLKLIQVTTYHAKPSHKNKLVREELVKLKGPTVIRGGTGTWSNQSLEVPDPLPPTRLAGRCTIISVEYFLEISLEVSGSGKKVCGKLPIIVGTVPFGTKVEDLFSNANNKESKKEGQSVDTSKGTTVTGKVAVDNSDKIETDRQVQHSS